MRVQSSVAQANPCLRLHLISDLLQLVARMHHPPILNHPPACYDFDSLALPLERERSEMDKALLGSYLPPCLLMQAFVSSPALQPFEHRLVLYAVNDRQKFDIN